MQWLSRLNVSTVLISGFLIVSAIGALIGVQGILKASQMNEMAKLMFDRDMIGLQHASEANTQLVAAGRGVRSALLARTEDERRKQLADMHERLLQMNKELDASAAKFATEKGNALVNRTRTAALTYASGLREVATTLGTEPLGEARSSTAKLFGDVRVAGNEADDLMSEMIDLKNANAAALYQETESTYLHIRTLLIALTAGGVAAGIAIGLTISRTLTRQLGGEPRHVVEVAGRIAAGDLSAAIETRANDNDSLTAAIKRMRDSLARVVKGVREGTDAIATASREIAAGNQDLSSRTEEQASSLEQTAASMEELTSTVKQNAENARQANLLTASASEVAVRGGHAMAEVVETMDLISASSAKIADIIGVINGIAFQTNILSLNAAVEAARAGEQGRGFAVVASEVRNLAQRSAAAAAEIKSLIDDSVGRVQTGTGLVGDAARTMGEIVESVERVTQIMGNISSASHEQSSGIEQVNQAIFQMDQVTQQNAALVEEAAAAAASLQEQAGGLVDAVSIFKLPQSASTSQILVARDRQFSASGRSRALVPAT